MAGVPTAILAHEDKNHTRDDEWKNGGSLEPFAFPEKKHINLDLGKQTILTHGWITLSEFPYYSQPNPILLTGSN